MKYIYFVIGIIIFSISCTSCDPLGTDICKRDYSFTIPVIVVPTIETFHLGDTIQISMNFPPQMIDDNSNDSFNLNTFPFNAEIVVIKIDQNPFTDSSGLVSYLPVNGDLKIIPLSVGGTEAVQIIFDKNNDVFQFSSFMILERKGVFVLSYQSNDFFDEFNNYKLDKECTTNSVKVLYNLKTDSTKTNYELLQQSPDPQIVKITREKFDKSGGFAFVVID